MSRPVDNSRRWTVADLTEIRRSVAAGAQPNDVAQRLRRSVGIIRRKAAEMGTPFPNTVRVDGPTPLPKETAAANYERVKHLMRFGDVSVRPDPRRAPVRPATQTMGEATS